MGGLALRKKRDKNKKKKKKRGVRKFIVPERCKARALKQVCEYTWTIDDAAELKHL